PLPVNAPGDSAIAMNIPYKLAVLFHKLQGAGCGPVRKAGSEFRCRCPAHEDGTPSLYVAVTEDRVLIRCGAGCPTGQICQRIDHDMSDLFLGADEPWVEANGDLNTVDAATSPAPEGVTQAEPEAQAPAGDGPLRHAVYAELLAALELG